MWQGWIGELEEPRLLIGTVGSVDVEHVLRIYKPNVSKVKTRLIIGEGGRKQTHPSWEEGSRYQVIVHQHTQAQNNSLAFYVELVNPKSTLRVRDGYFSSLIHYMICYWKLKTTDFDNVQIELINLKSGKGGLRFLVEGSFDPIHFESFLFKVLTRIQVLIYSAIILFNIDMVSRRE